MSLTKNTQEFPNKITERNIIILIGNLLRNIHPNESAAVKRISRKTGIEIRTIEGWFQSRNTPNVKNLLLLMLHYPEIKEAVMKITRNNIDEHITFDNKSAKKIGKQTGNNFNPFQIYRVIFDPINSIADTRKISDLNLRQLWFVNEIHNGSNPNSESIQAIWGNALVVSTVKPFLHQLHHILCRTGIIFYIILRGSVRRWINIDELAVSLLDVSYLS